MKSTITLIKVFLLWTLVGVFTKLPFLMTYAGRVSDIGLMDWLQVMWHGLRLDMAIAGYLSLIPAVMLIVNVWLSSLSSNLSSLISKVWNGYFAIMALIAATGYCVNIGLYGYWGFPLDDAPLLYIKTSPADAMASMTAWQMIGGVLGIIVLALVIFMSFWRFAKLSPLNSKLSPLNSKLSPLIDSIVTLLLAAAMIIPIRGGFGTGTNHTGSVYYSTEMTLNHAAVNPLFSFFEAVTHKEEIGSMYRFMDDKQATALFKPMTYTAQRTDTVDVLNGKVDNVIIIMLESFSKYIMTEGGHVKGVTPCLDALTREGLYFTNFYANSFRTDRAMVSILSGLPGQPTMSIMDHPHKSTSLPSIARTLGKAGWGTAFYYGGDMNYSNMQSYYVGTGFQTIVSDKDFPEKLHTGKWGVADGAVYDRMLSDVKGQKTKEPHLRVVMTSSSHEPFDVPNYHRLKSPELNGFSYADDCLGRFITELKKLPSWKNTLVVILPDHLGAYPENVDNYAFWRYEIPLVMVGGVVRKPMRIATIGCQTDLPATLLTLLGCSHRDFLYSRDIFDPKAPHFAFFSNDDLFGMVTDSAKVVYDNLSNSIVHEEGKDVRILVNKGKAYIQKLYDDIDRR